MVVISLLFVAKLNRRSERPKINKSLKKKIFEIFLIVPDTDTFPRDFSDLDMISPEWGDDLGKLDENMIK